MYMCLWEGIAFEHAVASEDRESLNSLWLESQVVMSCPMWVLKMEFRQTDCALNH